MLGKFLRRRKPVVTKVWEPGDPFTPEVKSEAEQLMSMNRAERRKMAKKLRIPKIQSIVHHPDYREDRKAGIL